ncbi:MAG: hypothetical protein JSW34_04170 [Candidatus Zixiibacteriota bacterium]|nr:MAG: hypothetical protein JSW34_04170 [candidate division Zixibacteria bacterium]
MRRNLTISLLSAAVCIFLTSSSLSRTVVCPDSVQTSKVLGDQSIREYAGAFHTMGDLVFGVSNIGVFGLKVELLPDYFTGILFDYPSEYPKMSKVNHLYWGTFWIGGILDGDTLVTQGYYVATNFPYWELAPDPFPGGGLDIRSTGQPAEPGHEQAVSEQDIIAVYSDTLGLTVAWDDLRGGYHQPLNIEVTQESYAWSTEFADDFVLFNMKIKNIGEKTIENGYFGVLTRPRVGFNYTYT